MVLATAELGTIRASLQASLVRNPGRQLYLFLCSSCPGNVPGAVELRKDLTTATSLDLPPMLVFDYPTVAALTDHLLALMPPKPVPVMSAPTNRRQTTVPFEVRHGLRNLMVTYSVDRRFQRAACVSHGSVFGGHP